MASSRDFIANQIRMAKLIMTGTQPGDGGIGIGNIGLSIYSSSIASNNTGGVTDGSLYSELGSEVGIFVSGSRNYRGRDTGNTLALFRGNLGTSGSMHFMNPKSTSPAATATLTVRNAGEITAGNTISFVTAKGDTVTITGHGSTTGMADTTGPSTNGTFDASTAAHGGSVGTVTANGTAQALAIATCINLHEDFSAQASGIVVTVTQVNPGTAGNTTITKAVGSGGGNMHDASLQISGQGTAASISTGVFSGGQGSGADEQAFIYADYIRSNHLYLKGSLYASGSRDANPYGTISGSIHKTRDGLDYIVAGTNVSIVSQSNGQLIINSTASGGDPDGMGSGFILEDGDGTEVQIVQGKEVKFVEGAGIDINWTDTTDGTDADPFDLTFTPGTRDFAGDSGTAVNSTLGSTFTIEGGANVNTVMGANKVTINATDTNTNQLTTFTIRDDDNDDFVVNHGKFVKFVHATGTGGTNITGAGTTGDPFLVTVTTPAGGSYSFNIDANGGSSIAIADTNTVGFNEGVGASVTRASKDINIAASGSAQSLVYSHMGPHSLISGSYGVPVSNTGVMAMKDDVIDCFVRSTGTGNWMPGPVSLFRTTGGEANKPMALAFKTVIPHKATKIKFTLFCKADFTGGDSGNVQFCVAGRAYKAGEEVDNRSTNANVGMWLGSTEGGTSGGGGASAWEFLPTTTVSNPNQFQIESSIYNISDIVNSASSTWPGTILDIAIARNRCGSAVAQFSTTEDTYTNSVNIIYVKVEFPLT